VLSIVAVPLGRRHHSGKSQDELAFDGGLGVVVGDDGGSNALVVGALQRSDHGLGGEAMAYCVAAGASLPSGGERSGALGGIAAIGLPLAKGCHGRAADAAIGFVSLLCLRVLVGRRWPRPGVAPLVAMAAASEAWVSMTRIGRLVSYSTRAAGIGSFLIASTMPPRCRTDAVRDDGRGRAGR
jgi:hypothetical protein